MTMANEKCSNIWLKAEKNDYKSLSLSFPFFKTSNQISLLSFARVKWAKAQADDGGWNHFESLVGFKEVIAVRPISGC